MTYQQEIAMDVLLCFIFPPYIFYLMLVRSTHISQVRGSGHCKTIIKAPFKKWLLDSAKVRWEYNAVWKYSLFSEDFWKHYCHASIYCVDNVGYVLSGIGIIRLNIWQRRMRKKLGYKKNYIPIVNN